MKALSHPTRVRIWTALGEGDATISQLSNRLALNKGNVAHHLSVLVSAGLARPSTTRTVRGGTERYVTQLQPRLRLPRERGSDTAWHALMTALTEELAASPEPRLHRRTIRLTPQQADALFAHLDDVLHSLTPADDRHRHYGVAVAVFPR